MSWTQGVSDLDLSPLYNFVNFLGLKFTTMIIVVAVIFSMVTEILGRSGHFSPLPVILSVFVVSTMLLMLAFVAFVIYGVYVRDHFSFMSLMLSAAVIFFLAFLAIIVRAAISERSELQIWPVVLALIVSLMTAAIFSALVKVAQRSLSA